MGNRAMRKRVFIAGLATVALVVLALECDLGVVLTDRAMHTARRPITPEDIQGAHAIADREHAMMSDVQLSAADGSILRAWSFVPRSGNGDAVIVEHGQGDNRVGMLGYADMLLRHGYAVLLPDSRAAGTSGGEFITFGVLEAGDFNQWFNWLKSDEHPRCVYAVGNSMGAAVVLEAQARQPGYCAVVAESGFSSFRQTAYLRMGQTFGTGPWLGETLLLPTVEAGLIYARYKYGVDLAASSPVNAVKHNHVPILLIHGMADGNLPPVNSERIKAADPDAQLWEPAGAGHCGAMSTAPEEYERRVVGWFESHDRPGNAVAAE
ncbi:MAG TPA: alpha/beta fold hydrolase [Terracidiphilus sp.]|nr:alpha/beta fold hydrolase [Terracidiphilus sp.]